MDVKNHNTNRKKRVVRKRWNAAVLIALFVGILLTVFQYLGFVSKTVYEESVSHLTEIFHQSDNMLSELTNKNLTYLHIWGEYLQNTSDESEIREYIEKAQEDAGFLDFYFLSADGNYKMVTGETGYLGLQENIEDEIRQGNDVITNATVPGKSQLLVFATPRPHGSYQGFEYDAIAIAYENSDIVNVLNISAFNGNAQSYVVHPDGRVVVDHSSEAWGEVYNFFGILREHSNMSEKEILKLSEEFKEGHTDAMLINLDGEDYYLVYEKSKPQDWIFLGLVQADIVNASMNVLQRSTVLLVSAVAVCIAGLFIGIILRKNRVNLKRKDTEILYRDELFQKLSMNVDDVFLMLDAKTYQADYVSPNVEKLLGITVEQIRKDICVLGKLHPGDVEDPEKKYLEEIQVHEQQEWDFEYVHQKTGEHRWFHNVAMGSEVNGKKKYILVLSDRTSDRKMNQALSEAVRAAETANKAKSTFLSNMSHDIRTPMNALLGYSELIKRELTDPKLLDYQEKMEQSGNLLLSIINNVLDMARIESGKVELDEDYVKIRDIYQGIYKIFQAEAEKKCIHLKMEYDVKHEHVICDETKNKEIFLNLISNAVKYTASGGRVTIRITELDCDRKDYVRIQSQVIDTGIGMSEEFLPSLFEAFARERNTTDGKIAGTGLGMPIIKKYIDMMYGTIEVESKQGEGSKFTVTLEYRIADKSYYEQDTEKSSDVDETDRISGKHILLAEDNDLNAEIAQFILEDMGLMVDRVEDGVQCVSRIEQKPAGTYDLILMDIQMPNMDGYRATEMIRGLSDKDKATIPIIAMTANAFEEDRKKALAKGMNGHIAKPVDAEKVEKTICSVLGSQSEQ